MKKTKLLIVLGIVVMVLFTSCNVNTADKGTNDKKIPKIPTDYLTNSNGFTLVEQNNYLELYINSKTAEVAVKNKENGYMWYSNPQNRSQDTLASGDQMNELASQVEFNYINNDTNKTGQINSYESSVKLGQFGFEKIDNGVRVVYEFGNKDQISIAPKVISKSRFEKYLAKMDDASKQNVLTFYTLLTASNISDEDAKKYPSYKKHDIYVLMDNVNGFVTTNISDAFQSAGYNVNQYVNDLKDNNLPAVQFPIHFYFVMDYKIQNGDFVVNCPKEYIKCDNPYKIININLLKFFGSASQNDNGYIFVPDGSGALINLNNKQTNYPIYSKRVYGEDKSIKTRFVASVQEQILMPVFGIKNGDNGFVGIIENGEAAASINASVSGVSNNSNAVYSSFTTNIFDTSNKIGGVDSATKKLNIFQTGVFDSDVTIRYKFLTGKNANYTGMAAKYRQYLVDNKLIEKHDFSQNIPFSLNLLGTVDYNRNFLGFPVTGYKKLTTYSDVIDIVKNLGGQGINDIRINYKSWSNGGIKNTLFNKPEFINELGGAGEFLKLTKYVKDNSQIKLFVNTDFMYIQNDKIFDSFLKYSDASKQASQDYAYAYDYDYPTGQRLFSTAKFIVKPDKMLDDAQSFISGFNSYNLKTISVGAMGTDLNSDFTKGSNSLRYNSQKTMEDTMQKIENSGYSISADGANAYVLKYVDFINNVSISSSNYYNTDKTVPFYQIVVHGYIPYSTTPINLESSYQDSVLKALETGSSPNFMWMYASNDELKNTGYDFYSLYYKTWLVSAVNDYKKLNNILAPLQDKTIVSHDEIAQNVYLTTYQNGTQIYVNYNTSSITLNNITIDAKGYKVMKEIGK
jgi:hypothetical protein